MLGLIERRARQSESRSSFGDRCLVDLYTAKHLVLDLNQVLRIEEVAGLEERVRDSLGMRIEHAVLTKTLSLCCIYRCRHCAYGGRLCLYNYAAYQVYVKCLPSRRVNKNSSVMT